MASIEHLSERFISPEAVVQLDRHAGSGLYLAPSPVGEQTAPDGPDVSSAAPVIWKPFSEKALEATALALQRDEAGQVLAIQHRDVSSHSVSFALEVGRRLYQQRGYTCVTSPRIPRLYAADEVRIPHLVAHQTKSGTFDDVIWELTTHDTAEAWLGQSLPDMEFFEGSLATLVALKKALREERLPANGQREITTLLEGTDLSIHAVYRHAGFFHQLLYDLDSRRHNTDAVQALLARRLG